MKTSTLWTIAFGVCATAYSSPNEGPEMVEIRSAEPGMPTLYAIYLNHSFVDTLQIQAARSHHHTSLLSRG
jgi:hypothetical protein